MGETRKRYRAEKTINGTWGQLWIDDEEMVEVISCEAKSSLAKTEVNQTGTLSKGYKVTGIDNKGTIKLNKVTSFFIKKLSDSIKAGKTPIFTIQSNLADPDAIGAERVILRGVQFDELSLINWEAGKLGEESYAFTFASWEIKDVIDHEKLKDFLEAA